MILKKVGRMAEKLCIGKNFGNSFNDIMQVLSDTGLEEMGNTTVTLVKIDNALLRFQTKALQKLSQSVVLSFEHTFSMKSVGDSISYECVINNKKEFISINIQITLRM
jgi:hypothetical protein